MTRFWWTLAAVVAAFVVFRKPLEAWYAARITGLEAAQDAAQLNTYTTYNTQIYSEPIWRPLLRFFKASAYAPSGQGGGAPQVDYSSSVQG